MIQLGLSAFYHDSAAALVIDGKVIVAIEEEKLSGIKHDNSFPLQAIQLCLDYANITINDIDMICWYEEPALKYDRVSKTLGKRWIRNFRTWNRFKREFKSTEGSLKQYISDKLGFNGVITTTKHHLSHLALSFYTSPFDDAVGISIDGVGEWDSVSIAECSINGINEVKSIKFPNSLGMVYSSITAYLGFKPNSGEYKVMGLAPYGEADKYYDIFNKITSFGTDSLISINQKYFTWQYSNKDMFTMDLVDLIGFEPREADSDIEQHHKDLAASLQKWYEGCLYYIINNSMSHSKSSNLVLGGGSAYNGTANGKIKKHCGVHNVWIPFAPSDAGSAIGACLYQWHDILGHQKIKGGDNTSPYLGPQWNNESLSQILELNPNVKAIKFKTIDLLQNTAILLKEGNIIGWFQGRTEFGARALGNRSILANPHLSDVRDRINKVVKKREMFRPFAPSVIHREYKKYFHSEEDVPYMNQVVKVTDYKSIPSVTHIDRSARIQTVKRESNPLYYKLLKEFKKITGTPILLNTSFNLRGQTMVNDPQTAIDTFLNCDMDYLVMGNYLISKL
jgi:carbamoyltransferase